MRRKLSLAYLTLPGTHPFDQIRIAKEAGYDCVSLRMIPMDPEKETQLISGKSPDRFRELSEVLRESGLSLLDIELARVREDLRDDFRRVFECAAELGASNVISSVWTEDMDYAADRLAAIAEQGREFGLTINLEYPVISGIRTLDAALKMQKRVGAPNLKILVDVLYAHLNREGGEKIRAAAPESFGIIHLCDAPKAGAQSGDITKVIREGREYPGLGDAKLREILSALPENPCSVELPNLAYTERYGKFEHAKRCLERARALFEEFEKEKEKLP